jgi:inner membrane transporter RhtA
MLGTLMALEPAIGVLLGLLVLHQQPSPAQLAGILLVVSPAQRPSAAADAARPPEAERADARRELDLIG